MPEDEVLEIIRTRPTPLTDHLWQPAHDLGAWVQSVFIGEGPLHNPDHDHLISCHIGWCWTVETNNRQGRRIVGQCEMPMQGITPKWQKSRELYQLSQWFDSVPTFLITLDAEWCKELDDGSFCYLVEHELYHCGQAQNEFGPRFRQDGMPIYAKRGHDIEDFTGARRRYGVGPMDADVKDYVDAVTMPPTVAPARIASACGTCLR